LTRWTPFCILVSKYPTKEKTMHKNIDLHTTVLFYIIKDKVLLGLKRRGFGAGKYNGFGGKVNPDENILDAVCRESIEEVGITPIDPQKVGVINYNEIMKGVRQNIQMHIFVAYEYTGEITPSDEMLPRFFDIANLPLEEMLPDTAIWMPLVLNNYYVIADFILNDDLSISSYQISKNLLKN